MYLLDWTPNWIPQSHLPRATEPGSKAESCPYGVVVPNSSFFIVRYSRFTQHMDLARWFSFAWSVVSPLPHPSSPGLDPLTTS